MKQLTVLVLTMGLLVLSATNGFAQKDSIAFDNKFGAGITYTGLALIESSVIELQFRYTMKHHAVALSSHIAYHDLFEGQSDWERYGAAFVYEYFPIRSNRLFSPFLFYDLNYAFSKSRRDVLENTPDGLAQFDAKREVTFNSLTHHFGIGTRCNFYKGLFLHLSLGAGPATFGESVLIDARSERFEDTKETEHPFSNYRTAFMFRFGLTYQIGLSKLKKGNSGSCCD